MSYKSSILIKLSEARSILREDNRGHDLPINVDFRIGAFFALSQFERRFLSQMLYLSRTNGVCFASDLYFENLFSISKGAVRRKIKFFQECGLITVFRKLGCRLIRVNIKDITQAVEELNSSVSDLVEGEEDMSIRSIKRQKKREEKKKNENKSSLSFHENPVECQKNYNGKERISKEEVKEAERLIEEIVKKFTVSA